MNAIPRLKHYQGAFLSYGFRPFFFLGASYAAYDSHNQWGQGALTAR
jgi:uncharacterized protein involved in response to NO